MKSKEKILYGLWLEKLSNIVIPPEFINGVILPAMEEYRNQKDSVEASKCIEDDVIKAGEKIIITDLGEPVCSGSSLSLNTIYTLANDFTIDSSFIVEKDNNGDRNGYRRVNRKKVGIKIRRADKWVCIKDLNNMENLSFTKGMVYSQDPYNNTFRLINNQERAHVISSSCAKKHFIKIDDTFKPGKWLCVKKLKFTKQISFKKGHVYDGINPEDHLKKYFINVNDILNEKI